MLVREVQDVEDMIVFRGCAVSLPAPPSLLPCCTSLSPKPGEAVDRAAPTQSSQSSPFGGHIRRIHQLFFPFFSNFAIFLNG